MYRERYGAAEGGASSLVMVIHSSEAFGDGALRGKSARPDRQIDWKNPSLVRTPISTCIDEVGLRIIR